MPAGRPLKFKSVKELEDKISAYFSEVPMNEWMITGLAVFLDCDRDTLLNYQDKPEYFGTIKKAKTKIEMSYEKRLIEKARAGDIFALKNFGWKDEKSIDHTTKGEKLYDPSQIKSIAERAVSDGGGES